MADLTLASIIVSQKGRAGNDPVSILTYEGQSCPEKYSIGGQQCGEQELGFVEETQEEYAGNLKYICVFPPPPLFFSFFLFFFFLALHVGS